MISRIQIHKQYARHDTSTHHHNHHHHQITVVVTIVHILNARAFGVQCDRVLQLGAAGQGRKKHRRAAGALRKCVEAPEPALAGKAVPRESRASAAFVEDIVSDHELSVKWLGLGVCHL